MSTSWIKWTLGIVYKVLSLNHKAIIVFPSVSWCTCTCGRVRAYVLECVHTRLRVHAWYVYGQTGVWSCCRCAPCSAYFRLKSTSIQNMCVSSCVQNEPSDISEADLSISVVWNKVILWLTLPATTVQQQQQQQKKPTYIKKKKWSWCRDIIIIHVISKIKLNTVFVIILQIQRAATDN